MNKALLLLTGIVTVAVIGAKMRRKAEHVADECPCSKIQDQNEEILTLLREHVAEDQTSSPASSEAEVEQAEA